MMGRGHAISGAAVWLSGCALAQAAGGQPSLASVVVGTAVCAGWALAPDLDHPNSVLARSAGPITGLIARGVARFGVFVHAATKLPADRPDHDGHRTVSHTLVWALLWGGLATLGQQSRRGPWVAAVLVFFAATIALRAALSRKSDRWVQIRNADGSRLVKLHIPVTVGLVLAFVAYQLTPAQGWWLGLAVAVGSLTHCLGDCLTNSACPLLWPIRIGRPGCKRAWYPVGPPVGMRFSAGSWVEVRVVTPLLVVVCLVSGGVALWPHIGPAVARFSEVQTSP